MSEIDTAIYRRLLTKVRTALMEDWDPIGVRDVPEARDEYDKYAPGICGLLVRGPSREAIVDHLGWITRDRMLLGENRAHNGQFADRLLEIASVVNRQSVTDATSE